MFLEILSVIVKIVILCIALFVLYLELTDPIIVNLFKFRKEDGDSYKKNFQKKVS